MPPLRVRPRRFPGYPGSILLGAQLTGIRNVIRKYYGLSILALLLIPVAAMLAAGIFGAIDPELARGHSDYARNFALLEHLRHGVWLAALVLLGVLWLLASVWLLRAKSRRRIWLWLALLGSAGFAVLTALADRSPLSPNDAYGRLLAPLPKLLRVLYEIARFAVFGVVAWQLVEWLDYGTALFEATRRGVALAEVLAERDASSGMWAFGDAVRAAYLFVLLYALWPLAYNAVAWLIRRRGLTHQR
jgi:hypothetical protein